MRSSRDIDFHENLYRSIFIVYSNQIDTKVRNKYVLKLWRSRLSPRASWSSTWSSPARQVLFTNCKLFISINHTQIPLQLQDCPVTNVMDWLVTGAKQILRHKAAFKSVMMSVQLPGSSLKMKTAPSSSAHVTLCYNTRCSGFRWSATTTPIVRKTSAQFPG